MEYPFKDLLPLDEVLEREGYYKDWTHLDPEVFYSLTQISEYIKTKGYGVDVRLLIAQLAEHFGLKTTQVVDLANLLQQKFTNLEGVTQSFTDNINSLVAQMEAEKDAVIANATVDSEVILARGGKPSLQARLDETTASFETVSEIISDTTLKTGDVVLTQGYYEVGDGGHNLYVIGNWNSEEFADIPIMNGMIARPLFFHDIIKTIQVGIRGDTGLDVTDDINNLLLYAHQKGINEVYVNPGTYLIKPYLSDSDDPDANTTVGTEQGIIMQSNVNFTLSNSTILEVIPNAMRGYKLISALGKNNFKIRGGKLKGDRGRKTIPETSRTGEWNYAIGLENCSFVEIEDMDISDFGDAIDIQVRGHINTKGTECRDVYIKNIRVDNCSRNGISVEAAINLTIEKCVITNSHGGSTGGIGIDVEPWHKDHKAQHITIRDCHFEGNGAGGVWVYGQFKARNVSDIVVERCTFKNNHREGVADPRDIVLIHGHDVSITDNVFESLKSVRSEYLNIQDNYIKDMVEFRVDRDVNIENNNFVREQLEDSYNPMIYLNKFENENTHTANIRGNRFIGSGRTIDGVFTKTEAAIKASGVSGLYIDDNYIYYTDNGIKATDALSVMAVKFTNNRVIYTGTNTLSANGIEVSDNSFEGACHSPNPHLLKTDDTLNAVLKDNLMFQLPNEPNRHNTFVTFRVGSDRFTSTGTFNTTDSKFLVNTGNITIPNTYVGDLPVSGFVW